METTALRKEIHSRIDAMPERSLHAQAPLAPLLSVLAAPLYTIEPASPEECVRVEERVREYHEDPSSFVPLESIR
jgi:hypothetical protein